MDNSVVATIHDENGGSVSVTAGQVNEALLRNSDEINRIYEESYTLSNNDKGVVTIDIHPPTETDIPIIMKDSGSSATIKPGRYAIIGEAYHNGEETPLNDGLFLMYDPKCVISGNMEILPVEVREHDEEGEAVEEEQPTPYWALQDKESGDYVSITNIVEALTVLASLKLVSDTLGIVVDEKEEAKKHPIKAGAIDKTDFPIDKVNATVWKLIEGAKDRQFGFDFTEDDGLEVLYDGDSGQLDTRIDVKKSGADKSVYVTYCVDFSEVENSITKKLEMYDKRVCVALGALFNAGYETVTLQQIYKAMGYEGRVGKTDRERINTSLTKLSAAKLHLDNSDEARKYNRTEFKYDGAVAPIERVTALYDGQIVEAAIHIFREPPPISFAKARKQFTKITVNLLNTPLSKTNANIALEDYLIERISRMKNETSSAAPNKMLYETIYQRTGIKTAKQKQRAPEKIKKLLDHYVSCGWISSYKADDKGVEILL